MATEATNRQLEFEFVRQEVIKATEAMKWRLDLCLEKEKFLKTSTSCLESMRQEEMLTDVKIKCGSQSFSAHKLILASHSPYFKAMFTHINMGKEVEESGKLEVEIKDFNPSAMKKVLQYMYTTNLELEDCVESILEVANYLGVAQIENLCVRKLQTTVSATRFTQVLQIFDKYDYCEETTKVFDFLIENIDVVAITDEFLELPCRMLEKFPKRNLNDKAIAALLKWGKHKSMERLELVRNLMRSTKKFSLTPTFAVNFLQDPFCMLIPELIDKIQSVITENLWIRTPKTYVFSLRDEKMLAQIFDHEKSEWQAPIEIERPNIAPNNCLSTFSNKNNVFFITTNVVHVLNIETKTWSKLPEFTPDCLVSPNVRGECKDDIIYVVDLQCAQRVVMNDPKSWQRIAFLPNEIEGTFHVTTLFEAIYIISQKRQFWRYVEETNVWKADLCDPMQSAISTCFTDKKNNCVYLFVNKQQHQLDSYVYKCEKIGARWSYHIFPHQLGKNVKHAFCNEGGKQLYLFCENGALMSCSYPPNRISSRIAMCAHKGIDKNVATDFFVTTYAKY